MSHQSICGITLPLPFPATLPCPPFTAVLGGAVRALKACVLSIFRKEKNKNTVRPTLTTHPVTRPKAVNHRMAGLMQQQMLYGVYNLPLLTLPTSFSLPQHTQTHTHCPCSLSPNPRRSAASVCALLEPAAPRKPRPSLSVISASIFTTIHAFVGRVSEPGATEEGDKEERGDCLRQRTGA